MVMPISQVREQGVGFNFKVLNPADGYRQDGRLWFGNCEICGERVTNSALNGVWMHDEIIEQREGFKSSRQITYCPQGEVEFHNPS